MESRPHGRAASREASGAFEYEASARQVEEEEGEEVPAPPRQAQARPAKQGQGASWRRQVFGGKRAKEERQEGRSCGKGERGLQW